MGLDGLAEHGHLRRVGRGAQQDAGQQRVGSQHAYGGECEVSRFPVGPQGDNVRVVPAPKGGDHTGSEVLHRGLQSGRSA